MCPDSVLLKKRIVLLPVFAICCLVVFVIVTGCLSGSTPGMASPKSNTPAQSGSPFGNTVPAAYNTYPPATGSAGGSCSAGLMSCNGKCVDITTDSNNCEGCGYVCPANSTCSSSQCHCKEGYGATADGSCVPAPAEKEAAKQSGGKWTCDDPALTACDDGNCYCGSCGNQCMEGQTCVNGACTGGAQQPAGADQPAAGAGNELTTCNGQQNVDLMTDNASCGACLNSCGSSKVCVQGSCQYKVGVADYCNSDSDCVGSRYPTTLYAQNHFVWVCSKTGEYNHCITDCQKGFKDCEPLTCINTQISSKHCGSCGNPCQAGQSCVNGVCGSSPTLAIAQKTIDPCAGMPGGTICNGQCYNLKTDTYHCGSCTKSCAAPMFCSNGFCQCPSGQTLCGGTCVDTRTSTSNCGSCGNVCPSGKTCANGVCTGGIVATTRGMTIIR